MTENSEASGAVPDWAGRNKAGPNQPDSDQARPNLGVRLRRIFLVMVLAIVAVAALAFGFDWAVFRMRAAANWNAYGSVTVRHHYAVLQKNGKTQFIFDPPGPQTCVNAVFPHAGLLPCWYLKRHPEQVTNI